MKKILVLGLAICSSISYTLAAPIVELSAPRDTIPKIIPDNTSNPNAPTPAPKKEVKKVVVKKVKKHIVAKKPKPIVVDYNQVSKMIEYGNYETADGILYGAIKRNSKDLKAQTLWIVSLAKQNKLDYAQAQLDKMLKQYPNNSDLHYAQGVVYYNRTKSSDMSYITNTRNLLNTAFAEFKKAAAFDKNSAKALNAAGVIVLQDGNIQDAKDYFSKAVAVDKTYATAIDNLGTMDYSAGDFTDAEKKFNQALSYNPQSATTMYHLAQVNIQKQNYSKALTYLNSAIALNPSNPALYNLQGEIFAFQGNEAAAINAFKKSIAAKPEFLRSYSDLATIYAKRGDAEFAIDQLKSVLSVKPDSYDAKLKIADIYSDSGKYNQAIKVYSELVGVDGFNSQAVKGLANAYFAQAQVCSSKAFMASNKDLYKALDYVNKAIALNGEDLELHLAKLKLSKITNQPDLARVELDKIVNTKAKNLVSNVVKGEAYLALNDYPDAQKAFSDAISMSQNAQDDSYLSEIFIYHKQYSSAEEVIQKILKNDPQNQQALNDMDYIQKSRKSADSYYKSAQYCLKTKSLASAMDYLSRSLAIDPNNANAHLLLAQLYEKQKDNNNAVMNYKAYLGLAPNSEISEKINKKITKLESDL